jgi:hypothetical protein
MIEFGHPDSPTRITLTASALAQIDWVPANIQPNFAWVRVCDLIDAMFKYPHRIEITSLRLV